MSLQNTWKKLLRKGKNLCKGHEAGVAGSVEEWPIGCALWPESSEPGRQKIRSRNSK